MKRFLAVFAACAVLLCPAARADAGWPTKPIRIVVPFSPGALTDVIARLYGNELSKRLGVAVVVENNPGGGGVIAAHNIALAPPDGYSLLFVSSGHAVNPSLKKSLPFDTAKDFSGIALIASSPTLVVVNGSAPVKTLADLVGAAKKQPEHLNYGSAGVGSATHLAGEYFLMETGVKLTHVPYKGVQEAVREVFAGRLDAAFPPIALAQPYIRDGRLRALAITDVKRSDLLPSVPTVAELGYKDFDYRIWYAFVTRSGVPEPVLKRIANELKGISEMPEIQAKLKQQGLDASTLALGDFDRYIVGEMAKLGKIVKAAGIKPD